MNKHVESMYKKARKKLGILFNIRKYISCETSLLIYKVMIRPHMEYGDFVVESAYQSNISKLDKLQEKNIRLAEYQNCYLKKKDMSILQQTFAIVNLDVRRKRSLLRLMYIESNSNRNLQNENQYITLWSSNTVKIKSDFTRLTKIQRSSF